MFEEPRILLLKLGAQGDGTMGFVERILGDSKFWIPTCAHFVFHGTDYVKVLGKHSTIEGLRRCGADFVEKVRTENVRQIICALHDFDESKGLRSKSFNALSRIVCKGKFSKQ